METLDSGHSYLLTSFDGGAPIPLRFVKRNVPKEKYPGNDSAYPGTLMQEVLRALIERGEYVNNQFPCRQTEEVIGHFAQALWLLEQRHAERHGLPDEINEIDLESVATVPFCARCGHIACFCDSPDDWHRAGGGVICAECGKEYRSHLFVEEYRDWQGEPWLRKLCNGDLVKT